MATTRSDGFLPIVDRIEKIAITDGFNDYPSYVEAVLQAHAGVVDSDTLSNHDCCDHLLSSVLLREADKPLLDPPGGPVQGGPDAAHLLGPRDP